MSCEFKVKVGEESRDYIMCGCITFKDLLKTLIVDFKLSNPDLSEDDSLNRFLVHAQGSPVLLSDYIDTKLPIRYGTVELFSAH